VRKLEEVSEELSHAWEALVEGWRRLYWRAAGALTQFHRSSRGGELQSADEREIAMRSIGWGVLAAELRDDGDKIVVRLEAPGMAREDFDLQVVGEHLVIRGEKHVERERSSGRYHICECAYGSFERAIALPDAVVEDRAKAKYKSGVLRVELPKAHPGRSKAVRLTLD